VKSAAEFDGEFARRGVRNSFVFLAGQVKALVAQNLLQARHLLLQALSCPGVPGKAVLRRKRALSLVP